MLPDVGATFQSHEWTSSSGRKLAGHAQLWNLFSFCLTLFGFPHFLFMFPLFVWHCLSVSHVSFSPAGYLCLMSVCVPPNEQLPHLAVSCLICRCCCPGHMCVLVLFAFFETRAHCLSVHEPWTVFTLASTQLLCFAAQLPVLAFRWSFYNSNLQTCWRKSMWQKHTHRRDGYLLPRVEAKNRFNRHTGSLCLLWVSWKIQLVQ